MQFSSRLGLTVEPRTAEMCKVAFDKAFVYDEQKKEYVVRNNEKGFPVLPIERISEEWTKLFLKGQFPGNVIKFLSDTGWIKAYPELEKCIGVKQDKKHHPESLLENHISQILNIAQKISLRENLNSEDKTVLLLAGLCHDLGKVVTTRTEKDKEGQDKITTKGHPEIGVEFARNLMNRIGINKKIIDRVLPMVQLHMFHIADYKPDSSKTNIRQLADKVNPANIKLLTLLMEADKKARAADNNPIDSGPIHQDVLRIKQDAEEQGVLNGIYKSLFQDKGGVLMSLFPNPKHRVFIGQIQRAVREEMLKGKNSKINTEAEAWDFAKSKAADLVLKDILNVPQDIIEPYHIEGPALGEFLKHLKEAYTNNQFSTRDQLLELIKRELGDNMTPKASSSQMLKYSSHNLNYNPDIPCPEEIIVLELKKPQPRWEIIGSVIGDENHCNSIKELYNEDRDFCIETYEEILDELLSGEVSDYIERKASKYSDDFDINLDDPFEDIKKFMGEDIVNGAISLINAVDPKALGSLTYVGVLYDSEEIGRFDKDFDNKVKNIYLSKVNPDIEEDAIVDEQKNRKGVSILISPERIEEKALSLSPEDYSKDVENELKKIILAEIVLHELDHAVGFDGENPSDSEQETYGENKNYLKIILNLVNQNRAKNNQELLPVDVKE
jgi:putative nucleotidyltransferase with HDIG domain